MPKAAGPQLRLQVISMVLPRGSHTNPLPAWRLHGPSSLPGMLLGCVPGSPGRPGRNGHGEVWSSSRVGRPLAPSFPPVLPFLFLRTVPLRIASFLVSASVLLFLLLLPAAPSCFCIFFDDKEAALAAAAAASSSFSGLARCPSSSPAL